MLSKVTPILMLIATGGLLRRWRFLKPETVADLKKLAEFYDLERSSGLRAFTARQGEIRISAAAESSEAVCDAAFAVSGVVDNGCAGYFELTGSKRFLFAPVEKEVLYFQCKTDLGAEIWAGNIFLADHPALKMTLVCSGQQPGKLPFLEIHNSTAFAISTAVFSPPSTPIFGGAKFQVEVPAGTSILQNLDLKK